MRKTALFLALAGLAACSQPPAESTTAASAPSYYGTIEPFASESIYFLLTDRFVNGDPSNDQREQGTFDIPVPNAPVGESANIGYLGGDFKGIVEHADYIRGMGFTSVWLTPVVDQPDAPFPGGKPVTWGGFWTDKGKTGYHGYWGKNFYRLDEHLPSEGLDFAAYTQAMKAKGLKTVLDIVGNHGSPAYTMPADHPEFGKLYDADGKLVADHQNLPPEQLDPANNPLHAFYNAKPGVAELSDLAEGNPAVLDYLVEAHLKWIDQGADAVRIDTIGWMPHAFWKQFAERIRARHPGMFMFGENFEWSADKIAPHTWPENGGISVLDFPLKKALDEVFGGEGGDFARLGESLYLEGGLYQNPYELVTFYDNHDMPRIDATDAGFIDAHNWLFTARGIPAVYYGSEIGFMRGRAEHAGNRNYFGEEGIAAAKDHPIRANLTRIAKLRERSPALQKGLQSNVELTGDRAAFYRVYQHEGVQQIALVLLNKGDEAADFSVGEALQAGTWRAAFGGESIEVAAGGTLKANVPAHGVEVFFLDAPVADEALKARLDALMNRTVTRPQG